jgi:hypothetical protein
LAEAVVGFVTVIFAATSWLGLYASLTPELVIILRIAIFGTAATTSVHLYFRVRKLETEVDEKDD